MNLPADDGGSEFMIWKLRLLYTTYQDGSYEFIANSFDDVGKIRGCKSQLRIDKKPINVPDAPQSVKHDRIITKRARKTHLHIKLCYIPFRSDAVKTDEKSTTFQKIMDKNLSSISDLK